MSSPIPARSRCKSSESNDCLSSRFRVSSLLVFFREKVSLVPIRNASTQILCDVVCRHFTQFAFRSFSFVPTDLENVFLLFPPFFNLVSEYVTSNVLNRARKSGRGPISLESIWVTFSRREFQLIGRRRGSGATSFCSHNSVSGKVL